MCVAVRILLVLIGVSVFAQCALAQHIKDEGGGSASFDKLVDVGEGRRLHITCSGMNLEESPTVVLESGAGNDSSGWHLVQSEVAKFTRVCAYDRAGLGSSDPVPAPHHRGAHRGFTRAARKRESERPIHLSWTFTRRYSSP